MDGQSRYRGGMAAKSISLVGGPAPYREAMLIRLEAAGFDVAASEGDALMICCVTDEQWAQAADSALWTPTVVVVRDLELDLFVKALSLGAGVVHLDTPTEIMVDVVRAAIAGEALLPLAITQALASYVPPSKQQITDTALEGIELEIADGLVADHTITQIASDLSYSDRTIRRKLQGIYLKLGVLDRNAAIEELRSRSQRQS